MTPSAPRPLPPPATRRPVVLVVSGDSAERRRLVQWLRREGVALTEAGSARQALELIRGGPFDVVLADPLALQESAFEKPRLPDSDPGLASPPRALVGAAASMRRLLETARKVARSESSVLITGESGTGKEVLARALHDLSPRRAGPFVPVNCSAIPGGLLESELFGHVRGAFTGAVAAKRGLFERAAGGTLLLDEIGDMDLGLQVKLLRVLQEREIRPVGSSQSMAVDVRIIAATNRDLRRAVEAGSFREDLFYRLNVIPLHIPPLRERPEDIPRLVRAFAERYGSGRQFTATAIERLQQYPWRGNVRELENVVQRVLALTDADPVDVEQLRVTGALEGADAEAGRSLSLEAAAQRGVSLDLLTRLYIDEMLAVTGGKKGEAARRLGIDAKTLYRHRARGASAPSSEEPATGTDPGAASLP